MYVEFPKLPDGLELDTAAAKYFRAEQALRASNIKPLSESAWMFDEKRGDYESAFLIVSERIQDPNADIMAANLRITEKDVSICRNVVFWGDKFWIAETSDKAVARIVKAMYWPLRTFESRSVHIYELLKEASNHRLPWVMLFRRD